MFRVLKQTAIVKKEVSMKRKTAWLFALILILALTACHKNSHSNQPATPGNLVTPTPYSPQVSEDAADVSGEYAAQLCSYPWLDTNDWSYYRFSQDGTYQHFGDKDLKDNIGSGKWQMKKDAQGYMMLHMEVDGGAPFDLLDLDLYDESIYAHSLTETSYIWLLCTPEAE